MSVDTASEGPVVLTASEAAALLKVSITSVRRMARSGHLPCMRLGRRVLFPRRPLERWIEEQTSATPATSRETAPNRPDKTSAA